MPLNMKVQPISDSDSTLMNNMSGGDQVKPVAKSRLKRFFERPFKNSSTSTSSEKVGGGGGEFEPSSVMLTKLVENFIEHGNRHDKYDLTIEYSSDGEFDMCGCFGDSNSSEIDLLKGLVAPASPIERSLCSIVEKIVADHQKALAAQKVIGNKAACMKFVNSELQSLGYDSSICKTRWEKKDSVPAAGEYEYIDVVMESGTGNGNVNGKDPTGGDRYIVDIDFVSEFEIARSTKTYKAILSILPVVFIGKADRLNQIIKIVSEAAKQSLKKKGMPFPPWRRAEYIRAKWLSPHTKIESKVVENVNTENENVKTITDSFAGEFQLIVNVNENACVNGMPESGALGEKGNAMGKVVVSPLAGVSVSPSVWELPAVKPRSLGNGGKGKIVTGLASIMKEKP